MAAVVLGSTVVDMVERIAAGSPDRLAVHGSDGSLSYRELVERADGVASRLEALEVAPGSVVGLCVERSAGLFVGSLGVLRAGCAYVAIDPRYPDDRIRWMLEDSGAAAVICDLGSVDRLGGVANCLVLGPGGRVDGCPRSEMHRAPAPYDLAYVVYTSGSTGRPKGVLVDHTNLANLVAWHIDAFSLQASDRCTQIASPGFDAVIWEIWPALATGASVHVVPEELRNDPTALRDWLVAKQVTVTFIPTAVAEGMLHLEWPRGTSLRHLLTGGDFLGSRPPKALPFSVINNYGLSETTVVATSGIVDPDGDGPPSIGWPIDGVIAEVVDEHLRPVPPGTPGELLVGGIALARGYLNRPALTAALFVDDATVRMYRTGDLVSWRPDGAFDFLGRLDDQLSIRGHRVEPGEVTAALNAHDAVAVSAVIGVGGASAERQLVAYLVPTGEQRPDRFELAEFLRSSLPEYLVPSRFVWLDELPLTPHGKVDKRALVAAADQGSAHDAGDRPIRTPTEAKIEAVLVELLDVEHLGADENFFLLGGHSMLGAQLIVRLEGLFDVELSLRYLFDHPTLEEIAAAVDRQLVASSASSPER